MLFVGSTHEVYIAYLSYQHQLLAPVPNLRVCAEVSPDLLPHSFILRPFILQQCRNTQLWWLMLPLAGFEIGSCWLQTLLNPAYTWKLAGAWYLYCTLNFITNHQLVNGMHSFCNRGITPTRLHAMQPWQAARGWGEHTTPLCAVADTDSRWREGQGFTTAVPWAVCRTRDVPCTPPTAGRCCSTPPPCQGSWPATQSPWSAAGSRHWSTATAVLPGPPCGPLGSAQGTPWPFRSRRRQQLLWLLCQTRQRTLHQSCPQSRCCCCRRRRHRCCCCHRRCCRRPLLHRSQGVEAARHTNTKLTSGCPHCGFKEGCCARFCVVQGTSALTGEPLC